MGTAYFEFEAVGEKKPDSVFLDLDAEGEPTREHGGRNCYLDTLTMPAGLSIVAVRPGTF